MALSNRLPSRMLSSWMSICSVSYTHLDVYKRQDLWRALQKGQRYDLIFLDVNMPGLDGIALGHKLRRELGVTETQLAYISGDAGHAMALYDNYPLNFLTKDDRLTAANVRDVLLRAAQLTQNGRENLTYTQEREVKQIPISQILYLESRRKQILLHAVDGSVITFYDTLDAVEERLRHNRFLRIHQSYLVNADKVARIKPTEVILTTGQSLFISKAYQKSAAKWLRSLTAGEGR